MNVVKSDTLEWDKLFLAHEYLIVNYHSKVDFPVYHQINDIYQKLSEEHQFSKIKFMRIDADSNPVAEQFIRIRKLPFFATFMNGFLVECNNIESEQRLREMIERLHNFKLKI